MDSTIATVTRHAGRVRLGLAGELDMDTGPTVRPVLAGAIGGHGVARVDVDLAAVTFCDCSGIAVLLAGRARARAYGVAFRVTNATGTVLYALRLLGLDELLTTDSDDRLATADPDGHAAPSLPPPGLRRAGHAAEGGSCMTVPFTVTKHAVSDDVARLAVTGEVDRSTSGALSAIIGNAVTAGPVAELIVDLDEVIFLDSAGITALADGCAAALEQGTLYRVVNVQDQVRQVLSRTGMLSLLTGGR